MLGKFIYCHGYQSWEKRKKKYDHAIILGNYIDVIANYTSVVDDGYEYLKTEEEIFDDFMSNTELKWKSHFDLLDENGIKYDIAIIYDGDQGEPYAYMIALCLDNHGATLIKIGA